LEGNFFEQNEDLLCCVPPMNNMFLDLLKHLGGLTSASDFVVTNASLELGGYDWVLPTCKRLNPYIRIYAEWITS
jgi:hypothetical protein